MEYGKISKIFGWVTLAMILGVIWTAKTTESVLELALWQKFVLTAGITGLLYLCTSFTVEGGKK